MSELQLTVNQLPASKSTVSRLKKYLSQLSEKFYTWLDKDIVASAKDFLGSYGKAVGHEPTFSVLNPTAFMVFGAGVVVGEKSWKKRLFGQRVIWYGDLNITEAMDSLVGLSRLAGDTLYVLSRNKVVVCSVRSTGDDNEIKVERDDVEQDLDGRYCYKVDVARSRNEEYASDILQQRGWLPLNLIEFYDLTPPKPSRAKIAKKALDKRKRRAKKRT